MGVLQNNYAQIVPGALISASYVSDLYDVLTGNEPEDITISGSFIVSGSAIAKVGFTGSLEGTASFATTSSYAVSSSYAVTASYAPFSDSASVSTTSVSSSYASIAQTALTASYVLFIDSSSAADTSISASYASTASYVELAQTASYADSALSASYAPPTLWSDIYTSATGRVIYVSPSGSDSNDGLSSIKPLQTLYAAKVSASAGDVIIIGAGDYVYDNRNTTGNMWNNRQNEINLWKDGVTYYAEKNSRISLYNESQTGQDLYLFNPGTGSAETCSIDGYLEFSIYGAGPDTYNGLSYFLYSSNDNGYTFTANVHRLTSYHNSIFFIQKSNITGTVANVSITSNEEVWRYSGGNVGVGSFYFIYGSGTDSLVNVNLLSKKRDYYHTNSVGYAFYIRATFNKNSKINISGEECVNLSKSLIRLREVVNPRIDVNINRIYYDYNSATYGTSVITDNYDAYSVSNYILNINADLIDYSENSYSDSLFGIITPNSTINYKGNIYTKTSSGAGKSIVYCSNGAYGSGYCFGNNINIDGNIYLLGSAVTTATLFQSYGSNNVINFRGKIYGNFQILAQPAGGGIVNINNAKIESTANNGRVYIHADNTTSTMRISNSDIKMLNTGSALSDGRYLNVLINNSNISNTGTTDVIYNSTSNGKLQILNSSIYTNSGSAINYSSSFNAAHTVINTAYSGSLTGSLTQLTEMFI